MVPRRDALRRGGDREFEGLLRRFGPLHQGGEGDISVRGREAGGGEESVRWRF